MNYDELKVIGRLKRKTNPLTTKVDIDKFTNSVKNNFDYDFNGEREVFPYELPSELPKDFGILAIVGASGSGKSTLLKEFDFYNEDKIEWDGKKAIISQIDEDIEIASSKLSATGLNSMPSWVSPRHVLSTGEGFRADLARMLKSNSIIDEFTSTIDRNVAKSTSNGIGKYIKRHDLKNMVFCSCHKDFVAFLQPDFIIDLDEGNVYDARGLLTKPQIELKVYEASDKDVWRIFREHHYLTGEFNKAAKFYLAYWGDVLVAMNSYLPIPSGTLKHAFRGHRLVVLPDFQGLGIGTKLTHFTGEILLSQGKKYFARSTHLRLGRHRRNSPLWVETATSGKKRTNVNNDIDSKKIKIKFDDTRIAHSFEYVGNSYSKPHLNIGIFDSYNNYSKEQYKKLLDKLGVFDEDKFPIITIGIASKDEMHPIEGLCLEYGIRTNIMFIKSKGSFKPNQKTLKTLDKLIIIKGVKNDKFYLLRDYLKKHKPKAKIKIIDKSN